LFRQCQRMHFIAKAFRTSQPKISRFKINLIGRRRGKTSAGNRSRNKGSGRKRYKRRKCRNYAYLPGICPIPDRRTN